jgi:hypothetical protein
MVTVHNFRYWDCMRSEYVVDRLKATVERIEMAGGELVPGTAEQVSLWSLDKHGRYKPQRMAPQKNALPSYKASGSPPVGSGYHALGMLAKAIDAVATLLAGREGRFRARENSLVRRRTLTPSH